MTVVNLSYTGATSTWSVPAGVTSLSLTLNGADGSNCNGGVGGAGATVSGTLSVSPGDTLTFYIGGKGTSSGVASGTGTGGWNGGGAGGFGAVGNAGGGGGGHTHVVQTPHLTSFHNLVAVAAGGGGASGYTENKYGGGGGALGGTGGSGNGYVPGLGGTQTAGGAGGNGAPNGSSYQGGDGYGNTVVNGPGGGGGGYFGGGGGGIVGGTGSNASGAGGGSSFNSLLTSTSSTAGGSGAGSGRHGSASITYTAIPAAPTLTHPVNAANLVSGNTITFNWTPDPTFTEGIVVFQYRAIGSPTWIQSLPGSGTTSQTLSSSVITPGTFYEWQVQTTDAVGGGTSAFSASSTFVTGAPAIAMSASTVMVNGGKPVRTTPQPLLGTASLGIVSAPLIKYQTLPLVGLGSLTSIPQGTSKSDIEMLGQAQLLGGQTVVEPFSSMMVGLASLSVSGFQDTFVDNIHNLAMLAKGSLNIAVTLGIVQMSVVGQMLINPQPISILGPNHMSAFASILTFADREAITSLNISTKASLAVSSYFTQSLTSQMAAYGSLVNAGAVSHLAGIQITPQASMSLTGLLSHFGADSFSAVGSMLVNPNLNIIAIQPMLGSGSLRVAGQDSTVSTVLMSAQASLIPIGNKIITAGGLTIQVFATMIYTPGQVVFEKPYLVVTNGAVTMSFSASGFPSPRGIRNTVTATSVGNVHP